MILIDFNWLLLIIMNYYWLITEYNCWQLMKTDENGWKWTISRAYLKDVGFDGCVAVAVQVEHQEMGENTLLGGQSFVNESGALAYGTDHSGSQDAVGTDPGQQQLPIGRQFLDPRCAAAADLLLRVGQHPRRVKIPDRRP